MSPNALEDMRREVLERGVNLFGNHQHDWENILGGIPKGEINNNQLSVGIHLNKSNPKYEQLLGTLNTPGVRLGLSVGGNVTKEYYEYNKSVGKKIKVIDGVQLYEISVVGIPSNYDACLNIGQAIAKCFNGSKTCPVCYSEMNQKCEVCLYE